MNQKQFDEMSDRLNLLQESELSLANMYETCSQKWPEDKEFFDTMKVSEVKHSAYIKQIHKLMSSNLNEFEPGKDMKPQDIKITTDGAKFYSDKVKSDRITKHDMLKAALKLEDSIIERKYSEILKTRNAKYFSLIEVIMTDTILHKNMLEERLAKAI